MKVYLDEFGEKRLIGRADVPADVGPVLKVPLFGPKSIITDAYTISTVTRFPSGGAPVVERAVILSPVQYPEFLPGWQPLAS
jgi:hypothetical protein